MPLVYDYDLEGNKIVGQHWEPGQYSHHEYAHNLQDLLSHNTVTALQPALTPPGPVLPAAAYAAGPAHTPQMVMPSSGMGTHQTVAPFAVQNGPYPAAGAKVTVPWGITVNGMYSSRSAMYAQSPQLENFFGAVDEQQADSEVEMGMGVVSEPTEDQGEEVMSKKTKATKKRVKKPPINGFRTGNGYRPHYDSTHRAKPLSTKGKGRDTKFSPRKTRKKGVTSTSSQVSPSLSLIVKLPVGPKLANVTKKARPKKSDLSGLKFTEGYVAKKSKTITRTHTATRSASDMKHIGPIFKTRRAVLARTDRPYICGLCGRGFLHPWDIKHHHTAAKDREGCWIKQGKPAGFEKWDNHPSAHIGYTDIEYAKVQEGYVILTKESWNKVEAACDAGRKHKEVHGVADTEPKDDSLQDAEGSTDEEFA